MGINTQQFNRNQIHDKVVKALNLDTIIHDVSVMLVGEDLYAMVMNHCPSAEIEDLVRTYKVQTSPFQLIEV